MKPNEHLLVFGHSLMILTLSTYHVDNEQVMATQEIELRMSNCALTCSCYDFKKKRWEIYVLASITHLPKAISSGTHVPFCDGM